MDEQALLVEGILSERLPEELGRITRIRPSRSSRIIIETESGIPMIVRLAIPQD